MLKDYQDIASAARGWSQRPGLSDAHRSLCETVASLAEALEETANAMPEAQDDLRILGCHLCRRSGESVCVPGTSAAHSRAVGDCPLGFQDDRR